jgi:hypothetical protein
MKPEINTETAETVPTGGDQAVVQERLVSGSFTPGPWKADGYHVRQSGQRGTRMIADVCYTGPHHTPPNEYPKSCRIKDEANARLIAAAPDMLEALMKIDSALSDCLMVPANVLPAWNEVSAMLCRFHSANA